MTQLSKVSAIKVISRTSVEQFRDTKLPIKNIGEQFGVKSILEGGVQRAGERVRINVQLIDAATDAHLWAETYDRELTAADIFAIQSEVAAAIAGALKATLTAGEKARVEASRRENLRRLGSVSTRQAADGRPHEWGARLTRSSSSVRRSNSIRSSRWRGGVS